MNAGSFAPRLVFLAHRLIARTPERLLDERRCSAELSVTVKTSFADAVSKPIHVLAQPFFLLA